jgi:diacylglycerol kinase family enzyme
VGHIFYRSSEGNPCSRYFIVAAGIGADALFFSRLDSRLKRRLGYIHYLIEALRLWATHSFPTFAASFMETGSPTPRVEEVSQLLAVRIGNFGGLVQNLVPGAAIHNDNLHVIAFKTRSRLHYLRFMAAVWFRRHTYSSTIELVDCVTVECRDLEPSAERLFVEADGELLGTLPVRIEVVPHALTLLVPPKRIRRATRL